MEKEKIEFTDKCKAKYKGYAIVNRPSNVFLILFQADKQDAVNILDKIVPIVGKLELIEVEVREV